MGPRESASQWWRIITMIRATFHGAPVLRERDSRNSRDPRQKEVQKAPQRKKTCNQRVKKRNFHDHVVMDLFSRVWSACTVSGTMSTCSFFFIYLIFDSVSFFFSMNYTFELYNYYIVILFCDRNEWVDIIFIGIKIKKASYTCQSFRIQEIFETFLKCDYR